MAKDKKISNAILFVNLRKNAGKVADEIKTELEKLNINVTVFSFEGRPQTCPQGKWDIAFSLGGDGTVLYTARMLASSGTPILPVHLGTLGFIAGVEEHEWSLVFKKWLDNTARLSSRCMLDISVEREGNPVMRNTCLNDAVVCASGIAKLIRLKVKTEISPGEFAGLGHYRSDGLIIATPTGSTAYSMAAGGPILDPEMEALIINPICPFTLSNRPIVLPSKQTLLVSVEKVQRSGVLLTVDGQNTFELEAGDDIIIRQSPYNAVLVTAGRSAYYSALRGKLSFGAVVSDGGIASTGGVTSFGGTCA